MTYAAVTERAALAGGRWLGRGDDEGAAEAATSGLRAALDLRPIEGRVVVGPEDDGVLSVGSVVGAGGEPVDLAVDPLGGPGVVARGGYGAMAMIAIGGADTLPRLPQMYMRKMAVGPVANGRIDLARPIADNVEAIADALGRRPNDVTAIVLDRPRHHDLVEELRASGARIKLIQDGDVTAAITCAIRGTNDHLAVGIGGARQAVIAAAGAALPRRRAPGPVLAGLAHGDRPGPRATASRTWRRCSRSRSWRRVDVIVAATGVSNGDLLRGVRYLADSARTHSLVLCTRCNWVRFVDGTHFFGRERREEIRLLG